MYEYHKVSMYEPLWQRLKAGEEVVLDAPHRFHRRIVKAMKNRKWADTAFKLSCSLSGLRYTMKVRYDKDNRDIIKFKLELTQFFLGANDL